MTLPTDAELTPWEKLSEPIPDQFISTRPPGDVAYITMPTAEWWLDRGVGKDGWTCEFRTLEATEALISVECSLAVLGVSKADAGTSEARYNDKGEMTEPPTFKAAYSDAFKRAARRHGVARNLSFS